MITTQDNSVNSINAALLRAGKSKQEINVNNVQNVTNVSKTNEVVKLSDGTTIDIKTLRETNKYLVSEIEALAKKVVEYGTQIATLQDQIQNIKITSSDGGKTLIFSNYLDLDSETNIPTVTAQYSSNGLEWHDNFIANQDIYIHFSYDAGGSWTDPIKIVGEDGSAYAYYGLAYNGGEMPADAEGNFFLCGADFTSAAQLLVNGDALILNEDTYLTVNTLYKKGFIYVYTNYKWTRIDDKDNFRYIIAINDLIKIGEPVSPGLLKQFENSVNLYTPHYLGAYTEPPASPVKGDTFCYIGETTTMYTKNMCYKYEVREDFEGWSLLDPSAAKSKECYMSALSDILTDADTYGSFANLFVGNIFASNIATNRLEVFEQSAVSTAAADATSKANAAKTDAISTASADATSKANQAKADAISTASADATSKANTAEQNAIDTAAQDATDKAALARLGAVTDIEELTGLDGLTNKTIIQGGKIRTDLIQASAIVIGTDQVTGLDTTLAGKASTQSVTALSNVVDTKASAQSVTDLGAVVSDKADSSTVDELSTTVDGKADSSTVSALATTVSEKADSSTVTALETTVSGKADTSTVNALSQTVDTKTTLDAVRTDIGTSSLTDKTIIVGGYLRTGVIGANSITADKIDVDSIMSKELVLQHSEESSGIIKSENYEDIETEVKITYQALVPDGKGTKFVYADNFEDLTSSTTVYGYGIIIKNKETEQQIESIFGASIYYYCDDVKDNDESKYILWGKNGNIETDSKKFIHIKYGDSTTYYLQTYKLFNTYKGFKIDTNGNAEFYGDTVIGGNARIDGVFNSIGGYRYNNSISWLTGSLDMETVMNKVKSILGNYYGKVHCYAELDYTKGSTLYRCYGIMIQQYNNGGFEIRGYASQGSGALYNFKASFKDDNLWIVVGSTNLQNAQSYCTLEIFY